MARFASIDGLEFAIMAMRWEHQPDLVSARDCVERLLRAMPRNKLAALHAGLNEAKVQSIAFGDARGVCEQAALHFKQGRSDGVCLLWLETGERARRVNVGSHEGNDD